MGLEEWFVKSLEEASEVSGRVSKREREIGERGGGELEFSQVMLICRYIKKWEDLFRNIDFHIVGMKNDIGHHLQSVSTKLWTVIIEIASNTWTGSQKGSAHGLVEMQQFAL